MGIKLIQTTVLLFVFSNLRLGAQWFQQISPTNYQKPLNSVFFINQNTGWAVGGYTFIYNTRVIIKTTDGGTNWFSQMNDTGSPQLNSVFSVDANHSWAVGDYGTIFSTINGGNNWVYQSAGDSVWLYSVHFVSNYTGWTVGYNRNTFRGIILKTSNSGLNWIVQSNDELRGLESVFFIDQNTGWASGGPYQDSSSIIKTTNGGINWIYEDIGNSYGMISSLCFIDHNTGWGCENFGLLLKTTNGGQNWTIFCNFDSTIFVNRIFFKDDSIGWAVGMSYFNTGKIMKTTNGGANWYSQYNGVVDPVAVYFIDDYTGWAVGDGILKTTTGGDPIGIKPIGNEIPINYVLHQNYPNPFNPVSKIYFDIPKASLVVLKIYNILGQLVQQPVNENMQPGKYSVDFDGTNLSSGIYFYTINAGNFLCTKKMILLK